MSVLARLEFSVRLSGEITLLGEQEWTFLTDKLDTDFPTIRLQRLRRRPKRQRGRTKLTLTYHRQQARMVRNKEAECLDAEDLGRVQTVIEAALRWRPA